MASLPTRVLASFQATIPVATLNDLDGEFNQFVGASGILNGGTTGKKLLVKSSDAADPPVAMDQIGAGPLLILKQNGSTKLTVANSGGIALSAMTACPNINADQVDGIEGADIARLSINKTSWTASWFIADPSTFPIASNSDLPLMIVPPINEGRITKIKVIYAAGSHTVGGSVEFRLRVNGADQGSLFLNNANNLANTIYPNDIADFAIGEDSVILFHLSARSGTIAERAVTLVAQGTQKFTT